MVCPQCGAVVLECDEVGTVFSSQQPAISVAVDPTRNDPFDVCPGCCSTPTAEFRPATSDEIVGLGFHRGEYA